MFKRVLSMVLVLGMLVSVLPAGVAAEGIQPQVETVAEMEEVTGETTEEVAEEVTEEVAEGETEAEATEESAGETEPEETAEVAPEHLVWEDWDYQLLEDDTISICGFRGTPDDEGALFCVVVPAEIGNVPVTEIAAGAFAGDIEIEAVLLPESIRFLGDGVFKDCTELQVIGFCGDEPELGENLVLGAGKLRLVLVPDGAEYTGLRGILGDGLEIWSVDDVGKAIKKEIAEDYEKYDTKLGADELIASGKCGENLSWKLHTDGTMIISGTGGMWSGATKTEYEPYSNDVTSIVVEDGVTGISQYAFNHYDKVLSVYLPNTVTYIGEWAFAGCSSLKKVVIPDSVLTMRSFAFDGCSKLVDLTIGRGLSAIGQGVFDGCASLETVDIPDNITSIGDSAFASCTRLKNVTIPESVKSIGHNVSAGYSFAYCSGLEEIYIPDSVTDIGVNTFSNCSNLKNIRLPSDITNLPDYLFSGCSSLEEIELPDRIMSIGFRTFADCTQLKKINFPGDLKGIGGFAFEKCRSLRSLEIPDGCTLLGSYGYGYIFDECTALSSVAIPLSVTRICKGAFNLCSSIKDVYYSGNTEQWNSIVIETCNEDLTNAAIHLNYVLPSGTVRYFSRYDAENRIAYFDSISEDDPLIFKCQVTDKTNTAFLDSLDKLVGTYVLVDSTPAGIGMENLLSIEPVESNIGVVQSVSPNTVCVNNRNYAVSDNLSPLFVYTGDTILYFLYKNTIVDTVTVSVNKCGTLNSWNVDSCQIQIGGEIFLLGDFADDDTIELLGDTGTKNLNVDYFEYLGLVHCIRIHKEPSSIYDVPWEDFKDTQNQGLNYIEDYQTKWREAYENWIQALQNALNSYTNSPEVYRDDTVKRQAKVMQDHDLTKYDRFLTIPATSDFDKYEDDAYLALARFFFDETYGTVGMSLPTMDPKAPLSAVKYVNAVKANMKGASESYEINGITYKINIVGFLSAGFGTMSVYKKNDRLFGNIAVCTSQQMTTDAVTSFLSALEESSKNQTFLAVKLFYRDVLDVNLWDAVNENVDRKITALEKKYAVSMSSIFGEAKVGHVVESLNSCYTIYVNAKKIQSILKKGTSEDITEQMQALLDAAGGFDDTTIKDAVVKKTMNALKKATSNLHRAFAEYLEGTIVEKEQSFWRLHIKCPVNVSIYDLCGNQIGYIGEDDAWSTENLSVRLTGEAKEIFVLADILPKVVITAEDYGTMDCAIEEYNCGVPVGRLNYNGISIEPNQEFATTLVRNLEKNAQTLTIESGDEQYYADEYISATDENVTARIFCLKDGAEEATIHGAGTYVRGDYAVVYAEPLAGYSFVGWYENDQIVSNEASYGFSVQVDRVLVAQYVPEKKKVYIKVNCGDGGFTIGEKSCDTGTWVSVLAIPDDGYSFAGWYVNGGLVSTDEEYGFDAVEDTTLNAVFSNHQHEYYTPQFMWSDDFEICTALFVCLSCDIEKQVVCTISNRIIPPCGTGTQNTMYTASAEFGEQLFTETVIVSGSEIAYARLQLDQDYLALPVGGTTEIKLTVYPETLADMVEWSVEGIGEISVSPDGTITALTPGTAYAVATLTVNGTTHTARCRIDVTEQAPNEEVLSIDLATKKLTTDLYSTAYATIDILPRLAQNEVAAFAAALEDNGVAITGAYLEDETARALFDLRVKDDRTLLVVPTRAAIEGAKSVKSSYSSKITVSVNGVEYHTADAVTIGVKKTLPKLKAGNLTFNPFYTGQSQALNVTGGTVTKIEGTTPNWLELEGTKLTLKNAPKSGSASLNLLVHTAEWAVPASVKVSVKLSYKAPAVKLSASSVSLSDAGSKGMTLRLTAGKQTLEELGVEGIRLPEGFEETALDLSTGEFSLVPTGAVPTGKRTLRVYFYNTDAALDLPLTVSKKAPALKLSKNSVNLNGDLGDSVTLKATATPADLDLTKVAVTNPDGALEVSPVNASGEFTVAVGAGTAPKATYSLTLQAPTGKAVKLTVKTLAARQKVTMSLKAAGSIDLTYPEKGVKIQPVFKNYSGELKNVTYALALKQGKTTEEVNFTDYLTLGEDGLVLWNGKPLAAGNLCLITMNGQLPDGSPVSGTVQVKVTQTAIGLKLSKTSVSLNKALRESTQIAVTSTVKDYTLGGMKPVVLDSKNQPSDGLAAAYENGLLTLAVNDRTAEGASYKVQIWATPNKVSTVTVKIPKSSDVTVTAKVKGGIDVIRDSSEILITPTYKNCLHGNALKKQAKVTWAKDGRNFNQDVTESFKQTWNPDGTLSISKVPGKVLELTGKYRLELSCQAAAKPALVNLTLKSGTAKITGASVAIYAKDVNDRAELRFTTADQTLNSLEWVELKDAKMKNIYEVLNLGNGQFALRLLPGAKAKSGNVSLNLFFEGGVGTKANATVSVKVEIR